MGFFKDLKKDFSQAIGELIPEDDLDREDETDQMVNTLDSEDSSHNEEAENEMKEWLEGFMQEDTAEDISEDPEEDTKADISEDPKEDTKADISEDPEEDTKADISEDLEEDTNTDVSDENNSEESEDDTNEDILEDDTAKDIFDNTMEGLFEEGLIDEGIMVDDGTLDEDIYEDVNEELNEKEILEEDLEDEVEDMSEKVDLSIDEMNEEVNAVDFDENVDEFDGNVDLDLLDALKAEEEQKDDKKKSDKKVRATSVTNEDDVTVISKGTTINGSISSDGSLEIMGSITGDVECLGKLSITGKIIGNSTAAEVYINTERLEGSINSEGSVKVGLGTVVVGDIIATSGVIAGAVKGEIDVNGPIVIDSTAIIKGNIKAKSVQINNGAVIEGFCSLSYSDVDLDNVFE